MSKSINRDVRCATRYADENRSIRERAGTKGAGHVLHLHYLSAVGKYLRKLFCGSFPPDLNCQHLTHSINFLVEHQGIGDDDLQSELSSAVIVLSHKIYLICMATTFCPCLIRAIRPTCQISLVSFCGVFSRFFYVWVLLLTQHFHFHFHILEKSGGPRQGCSVRCVRAAFVFAFLSGRTTRDLGSFLG
jgi:hypothetical protein